MWKQRFKIIFFSLFLCHLISAQDEFENYYQKLSLEEKIGQLLFVGFRDETQLKEIKAGGVALFSWNIRNAESARKVIQKIKKIYFEHQLTPTFLGVDHEGGRVIRMRSGVTPIPDPLAIGSTLNTEYAEEIGRLAGKELKNLGFNTNFAPVLDLGNARSFLQNRVWGSDPKIVSQMTLAFIKGLDEMNVLSVAKHFPGHGSSIVDAHLGRPLVKKSWEELWHWDLWPFRKAIEANVPAMMTAHAEIPVLTKGPASVSKKILTQLLRQHLGYKGLVISDDLEMQSIHDKNSTALGDLALQSLQAGSDMVLIVWSKEQQKQVQKHLIQAHLNGDLSESMIHEKVKRIWLTKKKYVFQDNIAESKLNEISSLKINSIELVKKILNEAIKWEAGDKEKILMSFQSRAKKKWVIWIPNSRMKKSWQSYRSKDEIHAYSTQMTVAERNQMLKSIKLSFKQQIPTIVVTAPRAEGDELFFQQLLVNLNQLHKKSLKPQPLLWVHQGACPVGLTAQLKGELKIGLLSLYSSAPFSFQLLTDQLKDQWKKISQVSSKADPVYDQQ
jgi:beta-N-acetylhexosaminidase